MSSANVPFEAIRIKISNNVKGKSQAPKFYGYKVTLVRDIIYSSLFWTMLETYRNTIIGGDYRENVRKNSSFSWHNFYLNLLPAFIIGGLVSAVTTPLDTLKTRVQTK